MRSYTVNPFFAIVVIVLSVSLTGVPASHAANNPFLEIDVRGVPPTVIISNDAPQGINAAAKTAQKASAPSGTYRVVRGDSLWKIAARFLGNGARYWEIVEANKQRYPSIVNNPNLIYPGWEFIIPGVSGTAIPGNSSPTPPTVAPPANGAKGGKALLGWLQQAGLSGEMLRMAWSIGMAESGGRPNALNNNPRTGDLSYGLFQINMINNLGPARLKSLGLRSYDDLFDPLTNIRAMLKISGNGANWRPWSVYKSGSYRKFYDNYPPK